MPIPLNPAPFADSWRPGIYADAIAAARDGLPDLASAAPPPYRAGKPPIRSTRKVAQWHEAQCRAHAYMTARIRDPAELLKLDAWYEQTMSAGPDFLKVRRNAEFRDVPIIPYDSQLAAEMMRQARTFRHESHRAKGQHGGDFGPAEYLVLEWFCSVHWKETGRFGMVPSLDYIAAETRMSRSTVIEALKVIVQFGMMTKFPRRKLIKTELGTKLVQDTNGYIVHPAKGLGLLALRVFAKRPLSADRKQERRERRARRGGQCSEYGNPPAIKNESNSRREELQNMGHKAGFSPMRT